MKDKKDKKELIEQIRELIKQLDHVYVFAQVGYDEEGVSKYGPVKAYREQLAFGYDYFVFSSNDYFEPHYYYYDEYGETWGFTEEDMGY